MALKIDFDWELEDYLRTFWVHKWTILITTLGLGVSTFIAMAQQPNVYQASARVVIEIQGPQVVQFQELTPYGSGGPQSFLQTEYRVIASRAVLSRVIEELRLAAFPPFSRVKDPVELLQGMILVQPVRGTKLVDIQATGTKPELVARLANTVADTYTRLNLERRQEMTIGSIQWLQNEVTKTEEKMHAAQLNLQAFMEEHGIVQFGEEQQGTIIQRIQNLNTAITETRKQKIEAETKYREKHPILQELQAKERDLQQALQEQEQEALEMNRLSIQFNTLQREAKTNEGIYNVLLTRLKELSVQQGLQTNNVQVVDHAQVPEVPIGPARGRITFVGTLFGLLLGGGLVFLREKLTKTLQTRRDFERILGIPFLGYVPRIPLKRTASGAERLVVLADPKSAGAESLRAIRTTLEFLLPEGKPSVLLTTSTLPEEGKSLVTLNLAVALQELGRKVLLVDADLRRPSLHRPLAISLQPGLSEYLQEKVNLEELVQTVQTANQLPVITAGLSPPYPTDLLGSVRFRELLETWKKSYQYVLIDTPPILVVADAAAIAAAVDGVIFVLRAGRTHGEAALAGKQRLVDVGAKLIGGILNGARLELDRGYRYYYYYYGEGRRRR